MTIAAAFEDSGVPEDRFAQRVLRGRTGPGPTAVAAGVVLMATVAGAGIVLGFPAAFLPVGAAALFLLFACLWSLPEQRRALSPGTLSGVFFAFFAVLILWPDYIALTGPGLPWVTPRRLTAIILLLTFTATLSMSRPWRAQLAAVLGDNGLLWKLVLAFAALQLLSVGLSADPVYSLNRALSAQLTGTLIFFAACLVLSWPGQAARLGGIFLVTLVPILLIGIYEAQNERVPWAHLGGSSFPFLNLSHPLVVKILEGSRRAALGTYRAQAVFSTPLGMAEYLALTFPFLLHTALTGRRAIVQMASIVVMPVVVWLVLLTGSRLGIVGICLSAGVYPGLLAFSRWRHDKRSVMGPMVVLAAPVGLVGFVVASQVVGRVRNLVWGTGAQRASNNARADQFDQSIDIMARNPFGHGSGRSAEVLGYTNPAGELTIDSYFLSLGLDYGILGIILFYGMFVAVLISAFRCLMQRPVLGREAALMLPLMSALTIFLVIKSIFAQDANHPIVYAFLGGLAALVHRVRREAREDAEILAAAERGRIRKRRARPILIHASSTV